MKRLALIGILALMMAAPAQAVTIDCDWNKTCSGNNLLRSADCIVDSDTYNFTEEIYCPYGCVTDDSQYGARCSGDILSCDERTLPFMNFSSQFIIGVGGMLMLVGAGLIVDNIIRYKDTKEKEFYGE